jgi:hypothetical protein
MNTLFPGNARITQSLMTCQGLVQDKQLAASGSIIYHALIAVDQVMDHTGMATCYYPGITARCIFAAFTRAGSI